MDQLRGEALFEQCLNRIRALQADHTVAITEPLDAMAQRIATLVDTNRQRASKYPTVNATTGIPDAYIDDVIIHYTRENSRVKALKDREQDAWQTMLILVKKRVTTNLRKVYSAKKFIMPFDTLRDDMTLHCAHVLWASLDNYKFDSALEAWVSEFVGIEVKKLKDRADFKRNTYAVSLEATSDPDEQPLLEQLPAQGTDTVIKGIDNRLLLEPAWMELSERKREILIRYMRGEPPAEIAAVMGETTNNIYVLKHRAVQQLRQYVSAQLS